MVLKCGWPCIFFYSSWNEQMSRRMTKLTKWLCAERKISLGTCPVWSEPSLSAWRKPGSLATHWAHSKDSDQTRWMPKLIWVFAGCIVILLVLLGGGSNEPKLDKTNKMTSSTKWRHSICTVWSVFSMGSKNSRVNTGCTCHFVGSVMLLLIKSIICIWTDTSLMCKICEPRHDKTNKMSVHPAKTQIKLGIRPVWSVSSLCAQWVAKDPRFLHVGSEDSEQTGRMPRQILSFR